MEKYLEFINNKDYSKLKLPAEIINKNGIVIFPTETVYGIGTNALNEDAIKKLYEIKKRPLNKPVSVLVNSIDMVKMVAKDINPLEYKIMEKFFPGPLTIILKKKDQISNILTANTNTIGVRMPDNEIALKFIEYAGVPIATTSANISGENSNTNIEELLEIFKENVDYYIDGGKSDIGLASTVVQIIDGIPKILRKGIITEEQIKECLIN